MFPVPTPPVRLAPPNVKRVRVEESAMAFPSLPMVRAVMVTVGPDDVAVTPTGPPSDAIAAARFVAFVVAPAPLPELLLTTAKVVPAVKASEVAPWVIVRVPDGIPL